MAVRLITYDLNREIVRPNIVKKIKDSYANWAKLSESSYAVATAESVEQVYNRLKPLLDSNDNLYVVNLTKPWTGFGPKDVNEWLERNLPLVTQAAY
jgi:CRISPR/Cas system-associated endoribonuclease Cas2